MSMPAIFFVSDYAAAEQFRLNHSLSGEDVAERSSVDTLKLSTLWAIMADRNDDPVELMDRFAEIRSSDSDWTNEIPEEFVNRLATATDMDLHRAATLWIETEEMAGCDVSDALDLLTDIKRVACRAHQTRRPMFVYVSL
jgi:hypothetical protein